MFYENSDKNNAPFCKVPHVGLNSQIERTRWWIYPLQDEDNPGKGPHSVPDFSYQKSKMFPERFRIAPGIASSEKFD